MAARRQEILDVALALADEGGLNAVTMRAIARRLGVTAMALYPHVASKDDLLDGLVGRLLQEVTLPGKTLPWGDRLRALGHATRDLARRHPAVMPLLFTRPAVTPDALRVVDAIFAALLDAGVPPAEVPRVERMVSTFMLGFAVSEVSGRFSAGSRGAPPSHDGEFDADLADLAGLVSALGRQESGEETGARDVRLDN